MLKVRFASIDRTLEKQLGINVFSTGQGTVGTVTTGQFPPPTVGIPTPGSSPIATVTNPLNLFVFSPNINVGATLEALTDQGRRAGAGRTQPAGQQWQGGELSRRRRISLSGGAGSHREGTGAVTIQFQEFGVRLNFIPTVTPRNTVRLQVAPEVSSLDYANGITISGFTVPGIDTGK